MKCAKNTMWETHHPKRLCYKDLKVKKAARKIYSAKNTLNHKEYVNKHFQILNDAYARVCAPSINSHKPLWKKSTWIKQTKKNEKKKRKQAIKNKMLPNVAWSISPLYPLDDPTLSWFNCLLLFCKTKLKEKKKKKCVNTKHWQTKWPKQENNSNCLRVCICVYDARAWCVKTDDKKAQQTKKNVRRRYLFWGIGN